MCSWCWHSQRVHCPAASPAVRPEQVLSNKKDGLCWNVVEQKGGSLEGRVVAKVQCYRGKQLHSTIPQ